MASTSFSSFRSSRVPSNEPEDLMRQVESLTQECERLVRRAEQEKEAIIGEQTTLSNFSADEYMELPEEVTPRNYPRKAKDVPDVHPSSERIRSRPESFSRASEQNRSDSVPSYSSRYRSESNGARRGGDSVGTAREEQLDVFTEASLGGNQTDPPSQARSRSRVSFDSALDREEDSVNLRFGRREKHPSEFPPRRGTRDQSDLEYPRQGQIHADSAPHHTSTYERETSRRPLMLPESYDGSKPWEDYLTHFESVAEINGWNCKEMARFLGANLKGEALEVYTEIPSVAKSSFTVLVEALERRFGHAHQTPLFRAQLSMRKRGRNESLQQLAQAVKRLVNGAYPRLDVQARDDIAIENFRAALDDAEIQRAVFMAKPRSLAEAVTVAVEMESFQQAQTHHSRQQRGNLRNVDGCQDSQSHLTTDLTTIRKALEEIKGTITELQAWKGYMEKRDNPTDVPASDRSERFRRPRRCWNCGEVGHFRRNCRAPRIPPPSQGNGRESRQ